VSDYKVTSDMVDWPDFLEMYGSLENLAKFVEYLDSKGIINFDKEYREWRESCLSTQ